MFLQNYLKVISAAVMMLSVSTAFKLPDKSDSLETWTDIRNGDEGQSEIINYIPVQRQRRRLVKYSENRENKAVLEDLPVVISFRNQNGDLEEKLVSYETETLKPERLNRFYKQRIRSPAETRARIIFPSDSDDQTERRVVSSEDDVRLHARFSDKASSTQPPTGSLNTILSQDLHEASASNQTLHEYIYSLESLAQIVRQILFRMPISEVFDNPPSTSGYVDPSFDPGTTTPEFTVQDQSLYSGPKIKNVSDCPEGYKRNRNGSCQKPSRRFG